MKKAMYYDEMFKERAIKLSCERGNTNAARELGVSYSTIVRWRKEYAEKKDDNAGQISVEQLTKEENVYAALGVCLLFGWLWPFE